jgi:hypothetical protein
MTKNIEFIAADRYIYETREKPQPAAKFIPEWWKDIPTYANGEKTFMLNPGPNVTVKKCISTLDFITAGYIVTLHSDLEVTQQNNYPYIRWTVEDPPMEMWNPEQTSTYQIPDDCTYPVFKFRHGWQIKTPPGWSSLFIHPVGYQNLPFKVIPGMVDTDTFGLQIHTPLVIKKDWTGIIEKGTPIFQVIPFERNSWEALYSVKTEEQHRIDHHNVYSKITGGYLKNFRHKRTYK